MANKKRVYWDSCNWIGLINEDPEKIAPLRYVYEEAKNKEIEILTSTFTLAEVFKLKCEDSEKQLPAEKDQIFEETLNQEFVVYVQLTREIGIYARRLLRRTEGLKIPQDAIHLASAAWNNVDELQTFDGNHLLRLDGKIERRDGQKLKICVPKVPPPQADLFKNELKQEITGTKSEKKPLNDEETKPEEKIIEGNKEPINVQE